ncbi:MULTISPECIES: hypothetical protein [Streptomyces]|jgi:hypothetical protein|uniref:Uncharacterized protein n=1 Tax=Streptomyces thermogriseus TaxID=75292 RepID=A0ABN1T2A3_9ACTN|nr:MULTISPECIES: hypothetical protein [Streptomyces]MDN5381442.1 hypothetical protein [Streptomyces sp. LB8]
MTGRGHAAPAAGQGRAGREAARDLTASPLFVLLFVLLVLLVLLVLVVLLDHWSQAWIMS